MIFHDTRKTRAEIDLDALAENYHTAEKKVGGALVAAVVKADAYGHGAVRVAKRLEKEGCRVFAVSCLNEALELRENDIAGRILILGYVADELLEDAAENDISLAVDTFEHLKAMTDAANGRTLCVHVKLDTGMSRTGFDATGDGVPEELKQTCAWLLAHPNIRLEGVFSHFAVADEPDGEPFSEKQFARYGHCLACIEKSGLSPVYRHICNSAGLERFPAMHMDMVRMGISLYGYYAGKDYRPVMRFVTTVVNVHTLKKGETVSYGCTYTAQSDRRIAVIGVGYADGFQRSLSGKGSVLIRGRKAPVVGRVCMDMTMIDVTDVPDVAVGDEVTLFGTSGGICLSAEETAKDAGTIAYELLCAVSKRVPRLYLEK